jgi:hypothetical protein
MTEKYVTGKNEYNTSDASDLSANQIRANTFISFGDLLPKLPIGERTARKWTRLGLIPSIRLPGSRRVFYHWPSVEVALLRLQRGGQQ